MILSAGPLSRRFLLAALLLLPGFAWSQSALEGTVVDDLTGDVIPGALVKISQSYSSAVTGPDGHFRFTKVKGDKIVVEVSHLSFETQHVNVQLPASSIIVRLHIKSYLSDEVTITATRADAHSAMAYSSLDKTELAKRNLGQDLPYLLNMTPSIVVTSDGGTGVGYTGLRIRGSDGTRVNVTLNGIPVNDAESHQVYWVDLPDLASSVDNIQIQRGVGTSTNGAGAFGGSVNVQTTTFRNTAYGEINSAYGSFNTWKNTVSFGTGLLDDKFAVEGRLSKITSDGYIDRANSDLRSAYLSAGYYGKKSSLKAILITGKEKTYQAWYGVPQDSLSTNRTFNPAGLYTDAGGTIHFYENQTDNYQQDYYQLLYSLAPASHWNINLGLHYTKGKGYYEEYDAARGLSYYGFPTVINGNDTITQSDFTRQRWLDNDFYGATWSVNYEKNKTALRLGGAVNEYDGDHFGEVLWSKDIVIDPAPKRYYEDKAIKKDASIFIKLNYALTSKLGLFVDAQARHAGYEFIGFDRAGLNVPQTAENTFFNPKAGLTFDLSSGKQFYLSVARANKEPVRDDYVNSSPGSRPKTETLTDIEAGYNHRANRFMFGINLYYMLYKDQLILTGMINDVGEYTRQNVPDSYRAGLEAEASFRLFDKLSLGVNATLSRNKISVFNEYIDNYDDYTQLTVIHKNADIAFSPSVCSSALLSWTPLENFSADLSAKYVGKQYLDNTSDETRKMDAYLVSDFRLAYTLKPKWIREIGFTLMLNNILNTEYVSNGYTFSYIYTSEKTTSNYYYPQAGIQCMAGLKIGF